MPTSSAAYDTAASVRSNRSRPGSSVATRSSKAPVEDDSVEAEAQEPTQRVKVATVTLTDQSTYHGEVNDDGVPDGLGVLLSVFGATYSGSMKDGKKHGAGVEVQTNCTTYSGEFRDGVASGYGIYVGALGSKYIGQWENGARHGIGVSVDAEAVMTTGHFSMDESELSNSENGANLLSWDQDVQPHLLRAVLAEKAAVSNQEAARQRHIDAVVQEMTATAFNTPEAIAAFEEKDEMATAGFIRDQIEQMKVVNADAGELKFTEAQLTQRQKELRADITAKRQELSFVAKYCSLAETRVAQVREAERTLDSLQRQLDVLAANANAGSPRSATETERHVPADPRKEF